jgi:hypothetical protein
MKNLFLKFSYYLPLLFNIVLLYPVIDLIFQYVKGVNNPDFGVIGLIVSVIILPMYLHFYIYVLLIDKLKNLSTTKVSIITLLFFVFNPFTIWNAFLVIQNRLLGLGFDLFQNKDSYIMYAGLIGISILVNVIYYFKLGKSRIK